MGPGPPLVNWSVRAVELAAQLGQRAGQQPRDVHLRDADLVGDLRWVRLP